MKAAGRRLNEAVAAADESWRRYKRTRGDDDEALAAAWRDVMAVGEVLGVAIKGVQALLPPDRVRRAD